MPNSEYEDIKKAIEKHNQTLLNHNSSVSTTLSNIDKQVGMVQVNVANLTRRVENNNDRLVAVEAWAKESKGALKFGRWVLVSLLTIGSSFIAMLEFMRHPN